MRKRDSGWLWPVMLACLALSAIALMWFPILRISSLMSVDYNEGWNAYRDQMAARGQPLYGAPPDLWITNYPFLSFHIIGLLSKVTGSVTVTGRAVALASLIAACGFLAGIVRIIVGFLRGGLYAGLCFFLWVAIFTPDQVAMNDPGFLALAIALSGLYAYLRGPAALPWLCLSGLAFAVAMFTKHDVIALPLGVGLHLLTTRNWRGLAVWAVTGAVAAGLLLLATFRLDGAYFFAHLLRSRAYAVQDAIAASVHYGQHFYAPLALGIAMLLRYRDMPRRRLLFLLFATAQAISILFAGGDGVALNIFYGPLAMLAVACAVAVCALERALPAASWSRAIFAVMLALPALPGLAYAPAQLYADFVAWRNLPLVTAAARNTIALLRQRPGPALCEDILLCYRAGKPLGYDPYFVKDQLMTGRLREARILAVLDSHHYAAIEIGTIHRSASFTPAARARFTKAFMQTLLAEYRPALINPPYAVFVPRP